MQKGLFFLFLILISLSNDSCTTCSCQKVTCPPYQDSALDAWMKTFTNKTILFKNQNGQTDTFTISTPNQSSAYEASKGCMGAQNGCTASLNIYSTELVGLKDLKFFLEYNSFTGWDNITSKQIRIGLKGVVLLADNISDTGFSIHQAGVHTRFNSALNLNGTNFNSVQLIQVDTAANMFIPYKMYFARNAGLVAFEEYPSGELWMRQ